MGWQRRLLFAILIFCLYGFDINASQCLPRCAPDDSCILIINPTAGDTAIEGDILPIKFVVGIDLVAAYLSIDSGKSWISLYTNAITVAACTTSVSRIRVPLLTYLGVGDGTELKACKIKISAYGSNHPLGISEGYFSIEKQNASIRFSKYQLAPKLYESGGYKRYTVRGQAISGSTAHNDGIYILVNRRGKIVTYCQVAK